MATAAVNPDSSTAVVVFNEQNKPKTFILRGSGFEKRIGISAQSIQTIQFHK